MVTGLSPAIEPLDLNDPCEFAAAVIGHIAEINVLVAAQRTQYWLSYIYHLTHRTHLPSYPLMEGREESNLNTV